MRIRQPTHLMALLGISLLSGCSWFEPSLELQKSDNVVIIGNTLAERMQYFGHFETLLHSRFPDYELRIRNLGYSADEVAFRPRSLNFGTTDEHLAMWKADVVLAFFGFNESFAGPEGLEKWKSDLAEFIQHTRGQRYNGESAPRLVLVSPLAHENLEDPNLPDGSSGNVNLRLYAEAMADVAGQFDVPFVDLFEPSLQMMNSREQPLTFNGVHLNESGSSQIAEVLDESLFGGHPDRERASSKLRDEVNEKNFFFFHRYRAVNGYYIYGGRSQRDNGNPPFTDAYVLENERGKLDDMVAVRDRRVWRVAQGMEVAEVVDDSGTRPLYDVPTNLHEPSRILPPEEAVKKFELAPGYAVNLFASEVDFPELENPMQLTFDAKGRLWILTMPDYPMFQPPNRPNDRLLILEDVDQDGRADELKVFADGLHVPTGFELGDGGVYVAQQPNLMFLKDIDGDDRADTRELILHGFDSADSHHSISAFTWGPGGGIYMHEGTFHHTSVETHSGPVRNAHGAVYRFEPTTQNFETFVTYNFANPWGHAFDSWGQNFVADASGGANYFATAFSGKAPQYLGQEDFGPFKFGNRSQMRQFIKMRVRPTAGCEFVSSGHFPPSAQGNFLLNNVIGFQGVLQHRMADEGSGFVGTEIEPLLFSSDRNFRPTDLQFGPDGALYVVDWFNPLIGHMQHNLRDPNRDKSHGRVWRITYPSRPLLKPPGIADESVPALLELLKSFEDRTRYRVRLELRERDTREVVAALEQWIADLDPSGEEYEHHLLEALWVHQHHNVVDESLLKRLLRSPDYRARAAATRVLSFWRNRVQDAPGLLKVQVNDDHPRVRLEAVRAASFLRGPEAARVALGVLEHPMDDYLEYTLGETIRALRPDWEPFMTSGETLVESAVGTDYLLGRLDVADLQKVARTRSSYRAFLARPGVAPEFREEALEGLATLNSSSPVSEVLEAIRRADREDSENAEAVLTDLGRMLESRPVSELEAFRQEIEAIAGSGRRQTTRQFGEVALIVADQGADRSWERAARSSKRLLNLLTSVPLISDPQLRASLFEQLAQIIEGSPTGGDRSAEIRAAAIAALPSLTGKESESARLLIRIVSGKEPDEAAIRAIGRLDRVTIDADDRLTLLQSLVRYLEAIPAGRRTSGDPLEAAELAEELASSLSGDGADDLRQRLSDLSVTVIEIKPIPHRMQYDLAEFFVEAGRPVEIVFENVDIMPHNLILTVPGARTEVGIAADRMAARPDAFDLQFIPRSDKVLFATRMLQPQQMEKLRFIAPNQVGDYPYLCTFPGHWLTMFGTMHVVADLDSVTPAVLASRDEAAVEVRAFVRAWKLEDLEGDLRALDADRNFENGAHLFEALSCSQCHRMNGRGGQVGPDLALVRDKLASGELDRAGLLREVVEPSGVVQKEYLMEVIETEDGRLFNGLVTHEDDRVIRLIPNLLDPERTEEVSKGSIKDRWQSTVSPMPEGLINTAERRDVFDLIAFLATGGLKPTAEVQPAAERENK